MPEHPDWPALALEAWEPTYKTLHRWLQVVGKVRLACAVPSNHWWHIPLYVTPTGLTTSSMPHPSGKHFQIDLDLVHHRLQVVISDGRAEGLDLEPMSVAAFYDRLMDTLRALGVPVSIWPMPVEVPGPVRFTEDTANASYDPEQVRKLHRALRSIDGVFRQFRGEFLGKCSPVHLFWGAFDLAVTRFSGAANPSPPPPDTDPVMHEAYSHEVISHGWWPGGDWPTGGRVDEAMFYAYHLPEPDGFRPRPRPRKPAAEPSGLPGGAYYDETFGEYLLPYEAVRTAADPSATLLRFLEATYAAGADAAGWDRAKLER
jgi:hypothetical protein